MFDPRFAKRMAARYRKRGLDKTARRMVELLPQAAVEDATVLEIGGGVGEIQLELLRRGATSATNLELSPAYDAEAARLLAEAGLVHREQRRLVDIAADPTAVGPADIVILHRVVCCYPDYAKLLGVAADHTRHHLVFSHPPRNWLSQAMLTTQNLLLRLTGREFRVFVHSPAAMLAVLADHGLRPQRHAPRAGVAGRRRHPLSGRRRKTRDSEPNADSRRPLSYDRVGLVCAVGAYSAGVHDWASQSQRRGQSSLNSFGSTLRTGRAPHPHLAGGRLCAWDAGGPWTNRRGISTPAGEPAGRRH